MYINKNISALLTIEISEKCDSVVEKYSLLNKIMPFLPVKNVISWYLNKRI